jgi:AraC-like DNA-binding protein
VGSRTLTRLPRPALRPFIRRVWAQYDDGVATTAAAAPRRERVLPTGDMHVVLRLSDHPLRLFAADDELRTIGPLIVGGARASYYLRELLPGVRSVGAQLLPGAALLLLGAPADELAERHTPLDDLWGGAAASLRAQLAELDDPAAQLARFEDFLQARLPRVHGLHPAVAEALARLSVSDDVGDAVRATGYSHRRFIALFSGAVGLAPKRWCRVRRMQAVLAALHAPSPPSFVQLALDSGFGDQPHFNREFRAHVGLSPREYLRLRPAHSHHVLVKS